jgi:hypothetical protein
MENLELLQLFCHYEGSQPEDEAKNSNELKMNNRFAGK